MRLLFLGRGDFGLQTLDKLLDAGHDIPLIVTCDHTPEVGGSAEDFRRIATERAIEYHHTNEINTDEWVAKLQSYHADLAVALLWLYIIKEPVVRTTRHGFLNYHAGDLPRYRGNACMNWAMLRGEQHIGLTVHPMEPGRIDSGPIVLKEYLSLAEESTIGEVTREVYARGATLVARAVQLFADGAAAPQPQNEADALYCFARLPRDGEIDWTLPADEIVRLVRSVGKPYPGAYSYLRFPRVRPGIHKLTIWACHARDYEIDFCAQPGHLIRSERSRRWAVVAGDKRIVMLDEIELDGAPVTPEAVFKSVRIRLGLDVTSEIAALNDRLDRIEAALGKRDA